MDSYAWFEWNGTLFWSRYKRRPHEPSSALLVLVDGIWNQYPGSAHFMLRSRIFINYDATELCRGVILVCAKRISKVQEVPGEVLLRMEEGSKSEEILVPRSPVGSGLIEVKAQAVSVPLAERNRPIEAWLLSHEGRLLACATNTSGRNKTQHAEMNLLRFWWAREKRGLPIGSRLITTLEPCPMCAGAIWECAEDRSQFSVQFVSPDHGPSVRRSVLRGTALLSQCQILKHP